MRKFTLLMVFVSLLSWQGMAQSCGNFNIKLEDSWIGGWEGGYVNIYINGTLSIAGLTILQSSTPVTTPIPVNIGDVISIDYTAGSNPTENKYTVYDETNTIVATEGAGLAIPGDIGNYAIPTGLIACAGMCPPPASLTTTNITASSSDLGWTENGSATAWEIEWGTSGYTQGSGTMITGVSNNPYNLTGLIANTAYDFYVRAVCAGPLASSWSGSSTFTTLLNVGINSISDNIDFSLYPNPNSGSFVLIINTNDISELEIKIMNLQGQVVFSENSFNNISDVNEKIDLGNNVRGIYFVTIASDKGVVTRKLVVQ